MSSRSSSLLTVSALCAVLVPSTVAQRPAADSPASGAQRSFVADFTGDALPDKVVVSSDGSLCVSVNRGFGSFESTDQALPKADVRSILSSDLNGDGHTDLYLVARGANVALLGDGGGQFSVATQELGLEDAGKGRSAERIDLDGDGLDDVLLHNAHGDVMFLAGPEGFVRDVDAGALEPDLGTLSALVDLIAGTALEAGPRSDVAVRVTLDELGRPVFDVLPIGEGGVVSNSAGVLGGSAVGGPAQTQLPPKALSSLDLRFVNDDALEVDGTGDIVDGTVTGADLALGTIDTDHLATESVTTLVIEDGTIEAQDIAANAVGAVAIAADAVGAAEIATGAVGTLDIAVKAITSEKIFPGAVGGLAIASDAVDASHLAADSVGASELSPNSVTALAIAPNAVGGSEIVNGSVTGIDVLDGSLSGVDIAAGTLTGLHIADGSLTGGDISVASGNVTILNGDVGVGTLTPGGDLHVAGSAGPNTGRLIVSPDTNSANNGKSELWMAGREDKLESMRWQYDAASDLLDLRWTGNGGGVFGFPIISFDRVGPKVGIGNVGNPTETLHVGGGGLLEGDLRVMGSETLARAELTPAAAGSGADSELFLGEDASGTYGMTWRYNGVANRMELYGTATGGATESGPHVSVLRDSSRLGIGVAQPTGTLHVEGSGGGLSGATILAENTITGAGVAIHASTEGFEATAVLSQNGSGSLVRGVSGGSTVFEVRNSGRVVTTALEITGGGDLVEPFVGTGDLEPGSVVAIDAQNPGRVLATDVPYDRRVAGIVSGAGGVNPGLVLSQEGVLEGDVLLALTGRVYVKCTGEGGRVQPGDLLVSSSTPGHAMKATDPARAFGAVVGKALTALDAETGLVLVLVSLQ